VRRQAHDEVSWAGREELRYYTYRMEDAIAGSDQEGREEVGQERASPLMPKQLQIFRSMAEANSVGWVRDDVHMMHVFAQAKPGEHIVPGDGHGGKHWPCVVCEHHGYTEAIFWSQLAALIKDVVRDNAAN